MARTAFLLITATLVVCLLPLFPDSAAPPGSSRLAARNAERRPRQAWIDITTGIIPASTEATPDEPAVVEPATSGPVEPSPPEPPRPFERPVFEETPVAVGAARAERFAWADVRAFLDSIGVERFRLETVGEPPRYRFTCWVPLGGNRYVTRQFTGEGATEQEAIGSVLAEIREWRSRSSAEQLHAER